jgi:WD repeat-containing protein 19
VGSAKGALFIYNKRTNKTIPIKGKHTKSIKCGAWNNMGKLALGSEDKQITISNSEGDNLEQLSVGSGSRRRKGPHQLRVEGLRASAIYTQF